MENDLEKKGLVNVNGRKQGEPESFVYHMVYLTALRCLCFVEMLLQRFYEERPDSSMCWRRKVT